jgi:hypothetical protein
MRVNPNKLAHPLKSFCRVCLEVRIKQYQYLIGCELGVKSLKMHSVRTNVTVVLKGRVVAAHKVFKIREIPPCLVKLPIMRIEAVDRVSEKEN